MWVYDEAACYADCSGPTVEVGPAVLKRAPLDGQVQIDVAGATLAEFGEFLDRHCEVELLIPASDASRKIEFSEEYITVRALIDRTGLVMAEQGTLQA
jgi:hypothetical protein